MTDFAARLRRWWPSVLVMVLIFCLSSIPSSELPDFGRWDFAIKKGAHALGYALLGLLYRKGLGARPRDSGRAWLLTIFYAMTDEFHQSMVAGRHSSLIDVCIDGLSSALALTFVNLNPFRSCTNSDYTGP
jgi:VanZ family protein